MERKREREKRDRERRRESEREKRQDFFVAKREQERAKNISSAF